jgi:hypothetical protein
MVQALARPAEQEHGRAFLARRAKPDGVARSRRVHEAEVLVVALARGLVGNLQRVVEQ